MLDTLLLRQVRGAHYNGMLRYSPDQGISYYLPRRGQYLWLPNTLGAVLLW